MRSSKSRSRKPGRNNAPNRSVGNVINRVFDSSGPEGKVRGTPQQIIDKYNQLARDAQLGNDRVAMENFQQHAEHYLRLLAEAQREMDQRRDQQERENRDRQAERDQNQPQSQPQREQNRDQSRDQNRDGGRDQGRDNNAPRDNNRDNSNRNEGQRDNNRNDNRNDGNRDQGRDRPMRQDRDNADRTGEQRAQPELQSEVLDLGSDSGLVDTPESKFEQPEIKQAPAPAPRAKAAPKPKAEASPDAADAQAKPKPKPRTRAPRKPKDEGAGPDTSSGTPEAAE
jgi:hypothetical protein